jgi:putative metallopeptidase DUF6775
LKISKIFLYDDPSVPEIKINQLAEFIKKKMRTEVEVRTNFLNHFNMKREIAYQLASCKVLNPYAMFERREPSTDEVTFEEELTNKNAINGNIILYDGFELQNILNGMISESELSSDEFHLAFTSRLICTFDYDDCRYHGRSIICSNPSIISTTGIIEAPAKPRAYYIKLYEKISQGLNLDMNKDEFKGRFLEYHDRNFGLIVRGYALQAIFYYLTGQAFCISKDCMLFNAHWQEDLLHSQIESGSLCDLHERILKSIAP